MNRRPTGTHRWSASLRNVSTHRPALRCTGPLDRRVEAPADDDPTKDEPGAPAKEGEAP
ncbi:hypothetical protein AB0H71_12020 [Nocardia sp. NPDC050697]|uniref:hypothetical protein n=1 Tax=Nocardia sp. NPDC050697 TaxID=3155158 RepID=UPI0033CFEC3D